jgi:hypothetical protein
LKTKRILTTLFAVAIVTLACATDLSKMMVNPLNEDQLIISVVNDNAFNFEISVKEKTEILFIINSRINQYLLIRKFLMFRILKMGNTI